MAIGAASTLHPQKYTISRTVVALSDMGGMLFMWAVNRRISARALDTDRHPQPQSDVDTEQLSYPVLSSEQERDDAKPEELEKKPDAFAEPTAVPRPAIGPHQQRIYLFTLSLIIQLLISGITNGHRATGIRRTPKVIGSAAAPSSFDHISHYVSSLFENGKYQVLTTVSRAVPSLTCPIPAFMTFALSTTLRSASFPIARCEQHLIAAAAAMPLAEIFSYTVIKVIGISAAQYQAFPLLALRSFTASLPATLTS